MPYFILINFDDNLLRYKLKSVLRNDCIAYESDKLSKNEYFILPRPVINPRSWNHNRMMDALNKQEKKKPINSNINFEDFEGKIKFIIFII